MEKYQLWRVYYDKEMVGQFLIPVNTRMGEEHYKNFLPEGYNGDKVGLSYSGIVTF